MMTYKFTNAIVRKPNKSINNALSSQYLHPSYEKILEIHDNYINSIEEVKKVELKLVWNPPWTKDMMSEEAKLELNL